MPFKDYLLTFAAVLAEHQPRPLKEVPASLQQAQLILTGTHNIIDLDQQNQFQRLAARMLQGDRTVLVVPDLSLGLEWARTLLQNEGYVVDRRSPDGNGGKGPHPKQVTVVLASRQEELRRVAVFLSESQEKARE